MSTNPVKFDRIAETLRQTKAPVGATDRALASLAKPRRNHAGGRLCTLAVVAAVLGFVLWPREHSGVAMAQIVRNTSAMQRWHKVVRAIDDGRTVEEAWRDGSRIRLERLDPSGKLIWEWRYDGHRRLEYVPFGIERELGVTLPNATYVVRVWRPAPGDPEDGAPSPNYAFLLNQRSKRAPGDPRRVDGIDRYTLIRDHIGLRSDGSSVAEAKGDQMIVDVDPVSHRILSVTSKAFGTCESVDYPASIPVSVFDVSRHEVRGLPIHDLDAEKKQIHDTLRRGLASKGGITVRLVALDNQGALWALWTGSSISAEDSFHPEPWRLLSAKSRGGYTMRHLTDGWVYDRAFSQDVPAIGKHLTGSALYPLEKLGDRVDIEIRANDGHYVRFNQVPIFRMTWFTDYSREFGIKTTIMMPGP